MAINGVRIKLLVDNKVSDGLVDEHGFSVWIEAGGYRLLFDTGQGKALLPNAEALGVDLRQVDALILSHGHYDHCGAVAQLLEINPDVQVFAHKGALVSRYSVKEGEAARDVAVPPLQQSVLQGLPESRMQWIEGPREILPGVFVSGGIERQHPLEDTGGPFFCDPERKVADPIVDDMSIWFETPKGLVIITGCCHSGLINTANQIRQDSGVMRIRAIIGGLHLMNASCTRLEATCLALNEWKPDVVVPCHCTGDEAVSYLKYELGSMINPGHAGMELVFD